MKEKVNQSEDKDQNIHQKYEVSPSIWGRMLENYPIRHEKAFLIP